MSSADACLEVSSTTETLDVTVSASRRLTEDTIEFTLVPPEDTPLPHWEPGAHIDVKVLDSQVRQYSLCGTTEPDSWTIAVHQETGGRGGSVFLHDNVHVGDHLSVSLPSNTFHYTASDSPVIFIAGGIGVTAVLPMIRAAVVAGRPLRVLYTGRGRALMPYLATIEDLVPTVTVHDSTENGRVVVADWLENQVNSLADTFRSSEVETYCCGPAGLMDDVRTAASKVGIGTVHTEAFHGAQVSTVDNRPFTVTLRSGRSINVGPDKSILEALRREGLRALSSCQEGVCGTCETAVLAGRVDHRDQILDEEERESNETMMICVSRALGDSLTLDL